VRVLVTVSATGLRFSACCERTRQKATRRCSRGHADALQASSSSGADRAPLRIGALTFTQVAKFETLARRVCVATSRAPWQYDLPRLAPAPVPSHRVPIASR